MGKFTDQPEGRDSTSKKTWGQTFGLFVFPHWRGGNYFEIFETKVRGHKKLEFLFCGPLKSKSYLSGKRIVLISKFSDPSPTYTYDRRRQIKGPPIFSTFRDKGKGFLVSFARGNVTFIFALQP